MHTQHLHTLQYTLHTLQNAKCTLQTAHCSLHTENFTLHTALHTAHQSMCTAHITLHKARYTLPDLSSVSAGQHCPCAVLTMIQGQESTDTVSTLPLPHQYLQYPPNINNPRGYMKGKICQNSFLGITSRW